MNIIVVQCWEGINLFDTFPCLLCLRKQLTVGVLTCLAEITNQKTKSIKKKFNTIAGE